MSDSNYDFKSSQIWNYVKTANESLDVTGVSIIVDRQKRTITFSKEVVDENNVSSTKTHVKDFHQIVEPRMVDELFDLFVQTYQNSYPDNVSFVE